MKEGTFNKNGSWNEFGQTEPMFGPAPKFSIEARNYKKPEARERSNFEHSADYELWS